MSEEEGIKKGLVCIFSVLEPCRTFSFKFEKGRPFVQTAKRKCLFIYFYFMDRELGLIHVKLQTWFPMQIQVYPNGHDAHNSFGKSFTHKQLQKYKHLVDDLHSIK